MRYYETMTQTYEVMKYVGKLTLAHLLDTELPQTFNL